MIPSQPAAMALSIWRADLGWGGGGGWCRFLLRRKKTDDALHNTSPISSVQEDDLELPFWHVIDQVRSLVLPRPITVSTGASELTENLIEVIDN